MSKYSFSFKTSIIVGFLILTSFTSGVLTSARAQTATSSQWQVTVNGLVGNPLTLTLSDLETLPQTSVTATIYCVDFPNTPVASGKWTGVSLTTLFEQAKVLPSAIKIAFSAADGYATDLDLVTASFGNVILAYEKDGEPLTETLRLVVPEKWGYKWISQVTTVTLVDFDFKGKWESQGYSDEANVQQTSHLPPSPQFQPATPNSTQPVTANVTLPTPKATNSTTAVPSQPTQASKPEPELQHPASFPTTIVAVALIGVAVAGSSLAIYAKKRRRQATA
jgi:hypothetical protein